LITALGIDVGGTFTDLVAVGEGRVTVGKAVSTSDPTTALVELVEGVAVHAAVDLVVHGTTVATNALLERTGGRVVLVVDEGFEDVIEIGRQARPALYDPFADRAEPVVPRHARVGWDRRGISGLVRTVRGLSPDAIAVALLDAYADGSDEARMMEALGSVAPTAVSHRVSPEFREFERMNTTAIDAYLGPAVSSYLEDLERRLVPGLSERVLVMRSSGGLASPAVAASTPASLLLSGPAGGVVAAAVVGEALGRDTVISFDMGGTSTDVCRIERGKPIVGYEREIDGHAVRMPSVAVHTVGAGGGSIGWTDPGGALRVGPGSAGANPGPACYGRGGGEPTVSDADLVVGRLGARIAHGMMLDEGAATDALAALGARLGLDAAATAEGMLAVVESTMEHAIRRVTVEAGSDPRDAHLLAFGGAGGMHATALARSLDMAGVIVPPHAGVFSALGMLLAPPRQDRWRTVLLGEPRATELDTVVRALAAEARADLESMTGLAAIAVEAVVEARYVGQAHETPVEYVIGSGWGALARGFHAAHARLNGYSRPGEPVEAVTVRVAVRAQPPLEWGALRYLPDPPGRPRPPRRVLTGGSEVQVPVRSRSELSEGEAVTGPAVIEDTGSTIWLGAGERAVVHPSGALEIEW
jgi:N-methylhydantoinase A